MEFARGRASLYYSIINDRTAVDYGTVVPQSVLDLRTRGADAAKLSFDAVLQRSHDDIAAEIRGVIAALSKRGGQVIVKNLTPKELTAAVMAAAASASRTSLTTRRGFPSG